ncbi:hypothetical protein SLS60_011765 [Paraconiothyrium brasiliense]|uniref:Uncharacterized protein n=1 Tax=Paraconiothyrium brasiliense TaxID=300254 RepID=A0ABR3QHZ0_9PLEO
MPDGTVGDWTYVKLQVALNDSITNFCNATDGIDGDRVIAQEIGNISVYMVRDTVYSFEECENSFAEIFSECGSDLKFRGGEVRGANGTIYQVYPEGSGRSEIAARRARGGRTRKQRPKKVKPTKTLTKKTRTRKTGTPSSTTKGRIATTSSVKSKPTKSCKQMYALAANAAKVEATKNEKSTKALTKRDGMGEDTFFEKRTTKIGSTRCAFRTMNALDYPDVSEMPSDAKYYSFDHPLICNNFLFGSSSSPVKGLSQKDYQIEHVLEWQVVTKFFDWLLVKLDKKKYENPNPNQVLSNGNRNTIKFCNYLDATWHGAFTPQFKLAFSGDDVERTALGHIKWAYPSKNHFDDEFVYLQTAINAPAKEQMWDKKVTKVVYGDTSRCGKIERKGHWGMSDLIRGHKALGGGICPAAAANVDDAREAYLKLKWIYGARQYLKSPDIKAIFKKQKERIGGVLDALDTEMENQLKTNSKWEVQDAWKKQGLKDLWNEYMDERFERAKTRSENDMNKYIRLLENVWLPRNENRKSSKDDKGSKKVARASGGKSTSVKTAGHKSNDKANDEVNSEKDRLVFFAQIQKLKSLWAKEKAIWNAPWL